MTTKPPASSSATRWYDQVRLEQVLSKSAVDAVLTASHINIGYFTSFESPLLRQRHEIALALAAPAAQSALLIPNNELARAFDDGVHHVAQIYPFGGYRYYDNGKLQDPLFEYYKANLDRIQPSLFEALDTALKERGNPRRIAFDDFGLTPNARTQITEHLKSLGATVSNGEAVIERIRIVKTPREINALEQASLITEYAFEQAIAHARPGTTERDLADVYRTAVQERGAEVGHWSTTMGEDRAWTGLSPSDRALRPNDLIRMDGGCNYRGYLSDLGCSIAIGSREGEVRSLHECLEAGLHAAVAASKPGALISEVFAAGVNAVKEAGIADYQRGGVGHGIGRDVYELPIVRPKGGPDLLFDGDAEDFMIEPGMILNLEMPYMMHGLGGFIVERTYVVEGSGVRQLGEFDSQMKVLSS